MPMRPCERCLENSWEHEHPDTETVRATCRHCGYEVEFGRRNNKKPKARLESAKRKITAVGQLCRDCNIPVVLRERQVPPKYKGQLYYYAHWHHCPGCGKDYFIDSAKVMFATTPTLPMRHAAPNTHIGPMECLFDRTCVGDGVAPWV